MNKLGFAQLSTRQYSAGKREATAPSFSAFFFLTLAFLFTFSTLSHASPPRSRGARPISLGNGYTAEMGDVYSLFYNPAGLFDISQKQAAFDYGRSHSENEFARTEFNAMLAMPYKWKEYPVPLGFGFYGEQAAEGAHIVDITAGGAADAPVEKWTKGFIKQPMVMGVAVNIRQQNGEDKSDRVGKSSLGLGLTVGLQTKLDRKHNAGFALRHLYLGDSDPRGPSANLGFTRAHAPNLNLMLDLEYASGGIWRFQPGMEGLFYRGVLRPRVGWGFRDNGGIDTLATGLGYYLSPLQIDFAYLIPLKSLTDETDQFRFSMVYRWGKPQFTEIYYDRALEEATNLDQNVLDLTVREAELKSSVQELEQKRRIAQEELINAKSRIERLKDQDLLGQREAEIRRLKEKVSSLESQLGRYRSREKAAVERKNSVKTHTVQAGDTLQSLANRYYGDQNQWKKIYNANPDKIERGLPRVGEKLVIP